MIPSSDILQPDINAIASRFPFPGQNEHSIEEMFEKVKARADELRDGEELERIRANKLRAEELKAEEKKGKVSRYYRLISDFSTESSQLEARTRNFQTRKRLHNHSERDEFESAPKRAKVDSTATSMASLPTASGADAHIEGLNKDYLAIHAGPLFFKSAEEMSDFVLQEQILPNQTLPETMGPNFIQDREEETFNNHIDMNFLRPEIEVRSSEEIASNNGDTQDDFPLDPRLQDESFMAMTESKDDVVSSSTVVAGVPTKSGIEMHMDDFFPAQTSDFTVEEILHYQIE